MPLWLVGEALNNLKIIKYEINKVRMSSLLI